MTTLNTTPKDEEKMNSQNAQDEDDRITLLDNEFEATLPCDDANFEEPVEVVEVPGFEAPTYTKPGWRQTVRDAYYRARYKISMLWTAWTPCADCGSLMSPWSSIVRNCPDYCVPVCSKCWKEFLRLHPEWKSFGELERERRREYENDGGQQ